MNWPLRNSYSRPACVSLILGLALLTPGIFYLPWLLKNLPPAKGDEAKAVCCFLSLVFSCGLLTGGAVAIAFAWGLQRRLDEVQRSDLLTIWQYTPEEWAAFVEQEQAQIPSDFYNLMLLPTLAWSPVGLVVFALIMIFRDRRDPQGVWFAAAISVPIILLMLLGAWYVRVRRKLIRLKNSIAEPPASVLHPELIHANGEFLLGVGPTRLVDVHLLTEPPTRIELAIQTDTPRSGQQVDRHRILVPAAELQRAAEIVAILKRAWQLD